MICYMLIMNMQLWITVYLRNDVWILNLDIIYITCYFLIIGTDYIKVSQLQEYL